MGCDIAVAFKPKLNLLRVAANEGLSSIPGQAKDSRGRRKKSHPASEPERKVGTRAHRSSDSRSSHSDLDSSLKTPLKLLCVFESFFRIFFEAENFFSSYRGEFWISWRQLEPIGVSMDWSTLHRIKVTRWDRIGLDRISWPDYF